MAGSILIYVFILLGFSLRTVQGSEQVCSASSRASCEVNPRNHAEPNCKSVKWNREDIAKFEPSFTFAILEWEKLTHRDMANIAREHDQIIVLIPVGSIEQHGPHMPLGTDSMLLDGIIDGALCKLQRDLGTQPKDRVVSKLALLRLPSLKFGASFEHDSFPGTIAIQDNTLNAFYMDITESVIRTFRPTKQSKPELRIIIVNSHGGQTSNVDLVARSLRFKHSDVPTINVNLQALFDTAQIQHPKFKRFGASEETYGIHAGAVETSLMMYLHPSLVQTQHVQNFASNAEIRMRDCGSSIEAHGRAVSLAWKSEDLNEYGAIGDASLASTDAGNIIFDHTVDRLERIIYDTARL